MNTINEFCIFELVHTELAVLCIYVDNQAILEPILLYRALKCKQTKEQGSEEHLSTHIFTLL